MLLLGDCKYWLTQIKDDSIDLTVTSPPYDNLRTYGGHSFDFEMIVKELYRVTKEGGIIVWIVGDSTNDGNESGTSFRQALTFKEIGFKLHDTMIFGKTSFAKPSNNRYHQTFEYMFVFAKGFVKTFNPLKDRINSMAGRVHTHRRFRDEEGKVNFDRKQWQVSGFGMRHNIWFYDIGANVTSKQESIEYQHPAIMPEALAEDHIKSWSNEGDIILDPFAGSGTTLKAAHQLNRKWIGIEINPEYVALAKKRLTPYIQQQRLTSFISSLS